MKNLDNFPYRTKKNPYTNSHGKVLWGNAALLSETKEKGWFRTMEDYGYILIQKSIINSIPANNSKFVRIS